MDLLLVFILGLLVGSFANVCIYRWPRNLSVNRPIRSLCPWCRTTLAWYDNIPVVSFLFLRGRCRTCRSPISLRYPLVEFALGLLWLGAYAALHSRVANPPLLFAGLVLFAFFVMLVTSLTDLDWRIIPDEATLSLLLLGVSLAGWNPILGESFFPRVLASVIGVLAGGGVLFLVGRVGQALLGREAMGGGDIKLLAALGAFLGWRGAVVILFLASVMGALVALAAIGSGRLRRDQYIPFGPFLNLAGGITFLLMLGIGNFRLEGLLNVLPPG